MAKGKRGGWLLGCLLAGMGVLLALLSAQHGARAQGDASAVRERYEKREVMIPMRDGVKLYAAVYVPRHADHPRPILLTRTPYAVRPYGPEQYPRSIGPTRRFMDAGYILVYQDVRGCYMSEGDWVQMRPMLGDGDSGIDEGTDAWDTIDWLVKNVRGNNGRVGMWGISYPGFYTAAALVRPHPALQAASPQAPIADWFLGDDFHHNGALFLYDSFPFLASLGRERKKPGPEGVTPVPFDAPDAYRFYLELGPLRNADTRYLKGEVPFWTDLMKHGTYDKFWQSRNLLPHLGPTRPAVLTVGGWFDAEDLYGPLGVHARLESGARAPDDYLVMGPWSHGGWAGGDGSSLGEVPFGSKTGEYYREELLYPFFSHYLDDQSAAPQSRVTVFDTGSHQWLKSDVWPPRQLTPHSLYLTSGSRLSGHAEATDHAFDEYVSDPTHPVPYTAPITNRRGVGYMTEDQRFAGRRTDVLSYEGEPLSANLSLAGPVTVDLWVSSTGTDSDWVVKLIDEFPEGQTESTGETIPPQMRDYEMLVRGDVMRAKFRHSFEKPEPLKPGHPTEIRFTMRDICHTFRKGHQIVVQVQSSWFPLVDRNPQKFVDIYRAKEEDFHRATQRVYHTEHYPSRIIVGRRD